MSFTYDELLRRFAGNSTYVRFILDMREVGIEVRVFSPEYAGAAERPAAAVSHEQAQDVIRATKLVLNQHRLGRTAILHP